MMLKRGKNTSQAANGAEIFEIYDFGPQPQPYRPFFGQIRIFETCLFAIDVLKISAYSVLPALR